MRGATCAKCNRIGHMPSMCRTKQQPAQIKQVNTVPDYPIENREVFLGKVSSYPAKKIISDSSASAWFVSVRLFSVLLSMFVDSGADETMITYATWKAIGSPQLSPTRRQGRSFSGHLFNLHGMLSIPVRYLSEEVQVLSCYVLPESHTGVFDIMGRPWLVALKFLNRLASVCKIPDASALVYSFQIFRSNMSEAKNLVKWMFSLDSLPTIKERMKKL